MLNLTKQERQVVLFLAAAAFIGLGIRLSLRSLPLARGVEAFTEAIGKIDINSADERLLMSVRGIGKTLARRILAYRKDGPLFSSIEQLKEIKGINAEKFEKIRPYFYVK